MQQVTKFLGIDISKDVFDVFTSEGKHLQFDNSTEGFCAYAKLLDSHSQSVMEATGSYHQKLVSWLVAWSCGIGGQSVDHKTLCTNAPSHC